jgi:hypothetical protein
MIITMMSAMIRARKMAPVVEPAIVAVCCLYLYIHIQEYINSFRI